MDKKCLVCDDMYLSKRADSRYCSNKCRKAATRQVDNTPVVVTDNKKNVTDNIKCDKCGYGNYNPANEWSHSACHKTQSEIEAHYTLRNFPKAKYYSLNGGGSGALSPYPKSNKRSLAYLDV